jgi:hypothetical protein
VWNFVDESLQIAPSDKEGEGMLVELRYNIIMTAVLNSNMNGILC